MPQIEKKAGADQGSANGICLMKVLCAMVIHGDVITESDPVQALLLTSQKTSITVCIHHQAHNANNNIFFTFVFIPRITVTNKLLMYHRNMLLVDSHTSYITFMLGM